MNKIKDTDLREALHRKYAETPKLPADFMTKMEEKLEAAPSRVPSDPVAGKTRRPWRWIAAAASLLLLIGIGVTLMPSGEEGEPGGLTAQHTETTEQPSDSKTTSYNQQNDELLSAKQRVAADDKEVISEEAPIEEEVPAFTPTVNPHLHYAAHTEEEEDTVPYQAPGRVDEFIAKLAQNNKVKGEPLKCRSDKGIDTTIVSKAYLFEDNKDLDLFGRLLLVACWYNSKTPGYLLNFSNKQFVFCLEDQHLGLKYLWVAERIGDKHILLFSTHSPIGTNVSSTCFQEYREQLTHTGIKMLNF